MKLKQILREIYRKLFVSENKYQVRFQVFNTSDDNIWDKYHDLGYLCEAVIMDAGKKPTGTWIIYSSSKTNIVTAIYDKRNVTVAEIQECLEGYGLKLKQIQNRPLKKFFGLIEFEH